MRKRVKQKKRVKWVTPPPTEFNLLPMHLRVFRMTLLFNKTKTFRHVASEDFKLGTIKEVEEKRKWEAAARRASKPYFSPCRCSGCRNGSSFNYCSGGTSNYKGK